MIIIAIETSCDETAIALVRFQKNRFKILSNIVSSQVRIHRKWGGVVPTLAKREHQKNLVLVLGRALKKVGVLKKSKIKNQKSKIATEDLKLKEVLIREGHLYKKLKKFLKEYQKPKVDLIAVTVGPGLEPALWVGVNFAKALGYFWNLPIIPVNHIEAHIFANFVDRKFEIKDKTIFPVLCLSVAGGHTQLILMKDYGKYKLLGETRDDAAGECLDKVARILGLGYPGGPAIARQAAQWKSKIKNQKSKIILPRPMIYQKNYDFSFSGLKTAVLYLAKQLTINPENALPSLGDGAGNKQLTTDQKREICAETQQAIIDVLIKKTIRAAKEFRAKAIILGGGVVANDELRKQFKAQSTKFKVKFFVPSKIFCTDNAAMVAVTAYFHQKKAVINWQQIEADANLRI